MRRKKSIAVAKSFTRQGRRIDLRSSASVHRGTWASSRRTAAGSSGGTPLPQGWHFFPARFSVSAMARRWRIRYKLLLGLGLVLAAFALMLTGTVQGLLSYMATMQLMDSKLAELDDAEEFKRAITQLVNPSEVPGTIDDEEARL